MPTHADVAYDVRDHFGSVFPDFFNGVCSMVCDGSQVAWTRPIPLADVKTVGTLIGKATVNDVVCAVLAGALRQMIVEANDDNVKDLEGTRESGFPLEDMRWAIPFDMRMPWNRVPGNIISTLWLRLPVTAKTPQQRLSLVQQRMDSMKKSPESLVSYYLSATLGNCPPSIAQKAAPLFMEAMHGGMCVTTGTYCCTHIVVSLQKPSLMSAALHQTSHFATYQSFG